MRAAVLWLSLCLVGCAGLAKNERVVDVYRRGSEVCVEGTARKLPIGGVACYDESGRKVRVCFRVGTFEVFCLRPR